MPAVDETLAVSGLAELNRAFQAAGGTLVKEMRSTLREVVEPVRVTAEQLAVQTIPRIGVPWSRMRVGVTVSSVYLAPRQRGVRSGPKRRPNLAGLLLGRAMEPALAVNEQRVVDGFETLLDHVGRVWETE